MKRKIDVNDYAGHILKELRHYGILLTTVAEEKVNTMTIGWGTLGYDFGRLLFIAYVRDSRHTHEMLAHTDEFTVNIPLGDVDKRILGVCGTKSGRDMDKIAELDLHLEPGETVAVPGIRELPLTLECKIIYREDQEPARLPADIIERFYSEDGYHSVYYGQILNAYIIED